MQKQDIRQVLERVRSGNYSSQDELIAKYWIHQFHQDNQVELSREEWIDVKQQIWERLETGGNLHVAVVRRLWMRIAVAAAILAAVCGIGFFFYQQSQQPVELTALHQDVAPGKSGATLTLSSGKKIRLTDANNGELAREAGVVITKTGSGELVYEIKESADRPAKTNMLSTANGETYQVRLPDGSLVWLNAASTLTYPANFASARERKVLLTGEAYFEIAKDKAHPFVVSSAGQEIEVLGTHFNVNAYGDEPAVATTLLEGSVKVSAGANVRVIKPGEQALNKDGKLSITAADTESVTDWKDGDFYFNGVNFRTAMREISRWYNVDIVYASDIPLDIQSGGYISRNRKLSQVLEMIQQSGQVKFKIEGRKIYVSR